MVFVKTMKRKSGIYRYWAHNVRSEGKIKVKLLRRLTPAEVKQLERSGTVEPLDPLNTDVGVEKSNLNRFSDLSIELKQKLDIVDSLTNWVESVKSGNIPNSPAMRPKAFIKKVLEPLLEVD